MSIETFTSQVKNAFKGEVDKYSPLQILNVEFIGNGPDGGVDGLLEIHWKQQVVPFHFDMQVRSAPSAVRAAFGFGREQTGSNSTTLRHPLVVVPYISEALSKLLLKEGISAIDLNGNYLILTPKILAIRLDQANEFPESREIKKFYSSNSSIVGRYLLHSSDHATQIGEVHEQIRALGGGISLSTVSKVLSALAEDLIIEKSRSAGVKLLQPKRLLENLRREYRKPRVGQILHVKLPDDERGMRAVLDAHLGDNWMWSGETSSERYSAAAIAQRRSVLTQNQDFASKLDEFKNERFYNCTVKYTADPFVYFGHDDKWASALETCLALSQMDKRERETADQIAAKILSEFE